MSESEAMVRLITFRIGTEGFGVEITRVNKIMEKPEEAASYAYSPDTEGAICLEGEMVTVLDLRRLLELEPPEAGESKYIMIFRKGGRSIAFSFDRMDGYFDVPFDRLKPIPPILRSGRTSWFCRVADLDGWLTPVLDPECFFEDNPVSGRGGQKDISKSAV